MTTMTNDYVIRQLTIGKVVSFVDDSETERYGHVKGFVMTGNMIYNIGVKVQFDDTIYILSIEDVRINEHE